MMQTNGRRKRAASAAAQLLGGVARDAVDLQQQNERLRAALDHIGAMVAMDHQGDIRFKPDYGPEDMLNAVNAALESKEPS